MNLSFYKNKNINKKIICKIILVIAFFAIQVAIIFYAKYQFKNNGCVNGGDANSVNYNMLYRIVQRISNVQSELNYLRGYILTKDK